jgi:hypothetical protein
MKARAVFGLGAILRFGDQVSDDAFDITSLCNIDACSQAMMSLIHASKHVTSRRTSLRSSYVEISRFFRTRHHGITPSRAALCSRSAVRSFVSLQSAEDATKPGEKLRKILDDFKATSTYVTPVSCPVLTIHSPTVGMGQTRQRMEYDQQHIKRHRWRRN